MKKTIILATSIVVLIGASYTAYGTVKSDIQGDVLKDNANYIAVINYSAEIEKDIKSLDRSIDNYREIFKDTKSKKAEKEIKRLKREWEYKTRQLEQSRQSGRLTLIAWAKGNLATKQ